MENVGGIIALVFAALAGAVSAVCVMLALRIKTEKAARKLWQPPIAKK
jgi:hypothetical protein